MRTLSRRKVFEALGALATAPVFPKVPLEVPGCGRVLGIDPGGASWVSIVTMDGGIVRSVMLTDFAHRDAKAFLERWLERS